MRRFVSQTGIEISVGEDANENDDLTFRLSRGDEHWFHVASFPGAHVVAHADVLDRETKRDAAILACHFSRAPRVSIKMLAVDYCMVSSITKNKKAPPGEVQLPEKGVTTVTVFHNRATEKARLGRLLTGLTPREYMLTE